jgi:hypothetical protein
MTSAVRDLVIDGPHLRSGQVGYLCPAVTEPTGVPCLLRLLFLAVRKIRYETALLLAILGLSNPS